MTVRWIKFTFLCFSMLSRMILEEFGTVNSPLCTTAPPKAKEKHKACNFQDRLGQKPRELRRISSASKCRSPPTFGDIKSRLTCKSQAKNLCNWPPLTTSKATRFPTFAHHLAEFMKHFSGSLASTFAHRLAEFMKSFQVIPRNSISWDHLRLAEIDRCKLQTM